MPLRRRGRASRQVVVDSRTLVSANREDAPQSSVPLGYSESQSSAFHSLASAVNRAVDFMESLVVGQTRVQQSTGQSVDPVPSGTSSSQPSVAPQSLIRSRFRPRGRQFKRSNSISSSSGGSSGARSTTTFCGQCGGKHKPSQCVGVRGACNNCGQVGHFARVCPTLGQRDVTRSSSRRPYRPFQSQRSGLQPTQVDAITEERDDVLTGGGCTGSCVFETPFDSSLGLGELQVDWAVKMRIRPPELETSICDAKYHVSLAFDLSAGRLVSFAAPLHRDLSNPFRFAGLYPLLPFTLAMSLFDLQDVCIAIGSLATLDLPNLIGIYGLKGPYCTLTTTNWFLQALSVIPRRSWGDVARRSYHDPLGKSGIVIPDPQWFLTHG
ncbi:hypothetical protein F511_22916 [Dorcoceras hygrometricum]|uniref:CCHC-type domain-containing protein n=1 Tax=Dorcoceras hygrometricum TaxID=472368 RepID=A0A2Z7CV27_9LAMI|nr:hypothetical protein F511_22916 [Dorcoceras hygrometricum]